MKLVSQVLERASRWTERQIPKQASRQRSKQMAAGADATVNAGPGTEADVVIAIETDSGADTEADMY